MGAGASSSPEVGVALNPRVEYASKVAQSEGKAHLIDVPVLVDLPDGTIRYRYVDKQQRQPALNESTPSLQKTDGPHRGNQELENKKGYFFHARLADYSSEANQAHVEADYKFKYVFKGPNCARNKRLYYVTGKGLHGSDNMPSFPSGLNTPTWPNIRKEPNQVYYNLEFPMEDDDSIDDSLDVSVEINSTAPMTVAINGSDSIEALKENVSMHILKPTTQISVFYQQHEIRPGTNVASLLNAGQASKDRLKVKLVKLTS